MQGQDEIQIPDGRECGVQLAGNMIMLGVIQWTNNLGRARHSVRAAVCQAMRSAGQGTARPASLASLFVIQATAIMFPGHLRGRKSVREWTVYD